MTAFWFSLTIAIILALPKLIKDLRKDFKEHKERKETKTKIKTSQGEVITLKPWCNRPGNKYMISETVDKVVIYDKFTGAEIGVVYKNEK